jgi:hypothetical protein
MWLHFNHAISSFTRILAGTAKTRAKSSMGYVVLASKSA